MNFSTKRDTINGMTGEKERFKSSLKGKVVVTETIKKKGAVFGV
ncbi:MAG: hypothetical protein OXB86_05825 [Bdellovibrionales bacterium]|nr:hypothetical protein [Bdellovibrionales bacterium]